MAGRPSDPDSDGDDTGVGPEHVSVAGTPLWVKIFGIIALVLVLLFIILLLAGNGSHGPGRHSSSFSGAGYQITLGNAATQQDHADEMAHNGPNSIMQQPGETTRLTWRYGYTRTLTYGCHEPSHYHVVCSQFTKT